MKRLLSILLTTVMLISAVPLAFAADAADLSEIPAILLNETKTVSLDRENIEQSFTFVPEETAEYAFYSNAENVPGYTDDTYGYIYDSEGELVAYGDQTSDSNFGVVAELEAGKTYVLKARLYYLTLKSEFPVSIVKTGGKATDIVLDKADFSVYVGETINYKYKLLPYMSADEEIAATSSNTEVVDFYQDGTPYAKGAGVATITLTSQNGLTATVSVTVNEPKELAVNTTVNSVIKYYYDAHQYKFTATQTGCYTIKLNSTLNGGFAVYDKNGNVLENTSSSNHSSYIYLEKGDHCIIWVGAYDDLHSYSLSVVSSAPATKMYIENSLGDHFDTKFMHILKAVGKDGAVAGEVEWTVSDPEIARIDRYDADETYLEFLKEGTVTVTAKCGDITATRTITGYDRKTVTVDTPATQTVEGFGRACFNFTAEQTGYYVFEINDELESEHENYFYVDNSFVRNTGRAYVEAGKTIKIEVVRNGKRDIDAKLPSANITVSAYPMADPAGIELDKNEYTAYPNQYIYIYYKPTNAGGWFENLDCTVSEENVSYITKYTEYVRLYFTKAGEYTATLSDGNVSKDVKVIIKEPEKLELNTEKTVTVTDSVKFEFTPDESAYYTVSVEGSDKLTMKTSYVTESNKKSILRASPFRANSNNVIYLYNETGAPVTATVKITKTEFPTSVKPVAPEYSMKLGTAAQFTLDFEPAGFEDYVVSAELSKEGIVLFDERVNGFRAIGVGTVDVNVTTEYGLKTSIRITVLPEDHVWSSDFELNKHELTLTEGDSETLTATHEDGTAAAVKWISDDESIARVDQNGKIIAVSPGTTKIRAYNERAYDYCVVTVTAREIVDTTKIFTDVEAGKWYTNAINYCYSYGFVAGVENDLFGLNTEVTRGMFITILARIAGVDTTSAGVNKVETKFTDVKSGKYYAAAIKWASENGIVAGTSDTTFAPDTKISRQDLCVMVVNFAKFMDVDLEATVDEVNFTDAKDIRKYAKNAVTACQKAGIITGYTDGSFGPSKTATRAEAAQILYKFHSDFMA